MKRLMLDYFRRKAWILVPGAVLEFVLGMVNSGMGARGGDGLVAVQIQLCLFMGALLLSFDLQQGMARTVATLPLTARQMGRAWWYATVAIPAAAFSAILFLGAGTYWLFHRDAVMTWQWSAMACVLLWVWMGTVFTLVFATACGVYHSGWRRAVNGLSGILFGVLVGGGLWLFENLSRRPLATGAVLVLGAALTLVGWIWSEEFVAARIGSRPGAPAAGAKRGPARPPAGYGGLPLLISTTCLRAFGLGVAMLLIMPLIFIMQDGGTAGWRRALESLFGMGFFPFWFVIIFSMAPALMQVRHLRSLPISATTLAATLLAVMTMPFIALGAVLALIAGLTFGADAALGVINNFLLTLAPASAGLIFAAWLGAGTLSYLLALLLMMCAQMISILRFHVFFHHEKVSFALAAASAGICLLLTFWLTRRALMRGSQVYRPPVNSFGNLAGWGWPGR